QIFTNLTLADHYIVGDFDGDNKPDIALSTEPFSNYLEILRNQANELYINYNGANRFCEGGKLTLHSSLHSGNQWYKDGVMVPGATADSLVTTMSGSYSDTVTIQGVKIFAD